MNSNKTTEVDGKVSDKYERESLMSQPKYLTEIKKYNLLTIKSNVNQRRP